MKFIKLALLIAAATLFVIACNNTTTTNQTANTTGQPTPATSPQASATATPADEFAAARATFATACARCHRADGAGGTVEVLKKKLKVPSLKEGHALKHTEEQLAKQISEGGDGMPAFKDKLKPEEIDGLVRYIREEIQGGGGAAKK